MAHHYENEQILCSLSVFVMFLFAQSSLTVPLRQNEECVLFFTTATETVERQKETLITEIAMYEGERRTNISSVYQCAVAQ